MTHNRDAMMLTMSAGGRLRTEQGEFTIAHFTDFCDEAIVLYKGNIDGRDSVIARIHDQCITSEVFYATDCDCASQMRDAQKIIQQDGCGIIIYLQQQGRGNGISPYVATLDLKNSGITQKEAFEQLGFEPDRRRYNIAAKIICYFNIKSVRLLSNNRNKIETLESWGIRVERLKLSSGYTYSIDRMKTYVDYQESGQNLPLLSGKNGKTRVLILGDLCIDYTLVSETGVNAILDIPKPTIGGTAYNAALSFQNTECTQPVVFGKVGDDPGGRLICAGLEEHGIVSFIETTKVKTTSFCFLIHEEKNRILIKEDNIKMTTNDYDLNNFNILKKLDIISKDDFVFFAGHCLTRCGIEHSKKLMEIACSMNAKILFDMVPHNMYKQISLENFISVIEDHVYLLIGELNTFLGLMGKEQKYEPTDEDIAAITNCFNARYIDIRFGEGNISQHILIDCREKNTNILVKENSGWEKCPPEERRGFGDKLTAELFCKYFLPSCQN